MAKQRGNHGKAWTAAEVKQLKQMAKIKTPTRLIAVKLKRTEGAIYQQASLRGISLSAYR